MELKNITSIFIHQYLNSCLRRDEVLLQAAVSFLDWVEQVCTSLGTVNSFAQISSDILAEV